MLTTAATLSRISADSPTRLGFVTNWTNGQIDEISVIGRNKNFILTFFDGPFGLVKASDGSLYVSEYNRHVVSKIATNNTVTRFAGASYTPGITEGTTNGRLYNPRYMTIDGAGNLYVVSRGVETTGWTIYIAKITAGTGSISRLTFKAGITYSNNSRTGNKRDWKDGSVDVALFGNIGNLCIDSSSNLYLTDYVVSPSLYPSNSSISGIRKITSTGTVSTVVSELNTATTTPRYAGLTCTPSGTLYYGVLQNEYLNAANGGLSTLRIYKRTVAGVVSLIAGSGLWNQDATGSVSAGGTIPRDNVIGANATFDSNGADNLHLVVDAAETTLYVYAVNGVNCHIRTIKLSGNFPVSKLVGNYIETFIPYGVGSGGAWTTDANQFNGQFCLA